MNKWISVKDRMPPEFRPVIACWKRPSQSTMVQEGILETAGWWTVGVSRIRQESGQITHWMPLPDPPETDL